MRMIFKPVAILCFALLLGLPSPGRAQWIENGIPVVTAASGQTSAAIVADGAGGAYIVWRDMRSGQLDIYMQRVNSWGEPLWSAGGIAVATGSSAQKSPCICLNSSGNVIVAYLDNASGNDDIYAQSVDPDGNILWDAAGMPVCVEASAQGAPQIAASNSGSAIIGWIDSRNGNKDIFAQRISSAGYIQWTAPGTAVCNAADVQDNMQMVADGSGGALFAWEDYRDATNLLIYAQKISFSAIAQWTANGVRLSTLNLWQNRPAIISDGAGGAIIAWYDMRNGTDNNIYAKRVLSNGSGTWSSLGVYACLTAGEQTDPRLIPDGEGGAIIVWTDAGANPPYTDVFAQRLNSYGNAQWGTSGSAISDGAGSQYQPTIVPDGAGGALIAWQDTRLATSADIYAQRINASGATQWLVGGEKVCTAYNSQSTPQIVTDGAEGGIIAWHDMRTYDETNWDIYAQRIERHGYGGYPAPLNLAGIDVPHDNGGRVLLSWDASYLDGFPEELITHYIIWRSIDEGMTYNAIDTMDAYYLESYQYAARTTADSSIAGEATHWFRVTANTLMSDYTWTSKTVACHSVDNLIPASPFALVAEQSFEPAGLALAWTPNSEPDLSHYAVYRGESADFVPGAGNLIGATEKASFFDGTWRWNSGYFYKVSAVDVNGNESAFAELAPEGVSGLEPPGVPGATYLAQNYPNPFNPTTRIAFALKEPASISLRIYDTAGRLVRALAEGDRTAGTYAELWDGKDAGGRAVGSGIYFYRLIAGRFSETRKMILLR